MVDVWCGERLCGKCCTNVSNMKWTQPEDSLRHSANIEELVIPENLHLDLVVKVVWPLRFV